MTINPHVPLHRLVLSVSQGIDDVHPSVADHQLRVAYISTNVARRLGLCGADLLAVFEAAALHDIGLLGMESRLLFMHHGNFERVSWHDEAGYELLRDHDLFARAADIVRHHHTPWQHGRGTERDGEPVPFASHIVCLADAAERAIDRELPILEQNDFITRQLRVLAGKHLHPDCVDAFQEVARCEAFWLDCVSQRIYSILLGQMDWPSLTVDGATIERIAEIFARVVDAISQWTATHSAGVSAVAAALARRLGFSPREQTLMRGAGYLHDIGKLSVPGRILEKAGPLAPQEWAIVKGHTYHTFCILGSIGGMPQLTEWAAFHHERIDGAGYPFRHAGDDLTLGSRVMAVADSFAAITEARPYRQPLELGPALATLDADAAGGALDGDVVAILRRDGQEIHAAAQQARARYNEKQQHLAAFMAGPAIAEAQTP
jgi:putative nucleotidyltransferase with HDIG domain